MNDEKIFTLDFIDDEFKKLNLRACDGDKPSSFSIVSLTSCDSNLHQHGKVMCVYYSYMGLYAHIHVHVHLHVK